MRKFFYIKNLILDILKTHLKSDRKKFFRMFATFDQKVFDKVSS